MTFTLGRHVNHDPRSKDYAFEVTKAPGTVLWNHSAPVLDQGDLGSCTGNALAQWLNVTINKRINRPTMTEKNAVALYSAATRLDDAPGQYPPTDTGSSGLAVCKAGRIAGYLSSYRHVFSFNSFLSTVQHTPVIVGTAWYEGMFEPDANNVLNLSGAVAGGHEYLILGVDVNTKLVTILNSWGSSWGRNGRAFIRFDDFRALLADSGDITVPII